MPPPAHCPEGCHACCRSWVTLDLTAVEALTVYLLNREMVELIERAHHLRPEDDYCPFLIQNRCSIHAYKPSACQMFMPFTSQGKPTCYYLAKERGDLQVAAEGEQYLNSHAYAIHGLMMLLQCMVGSHLPCIFFKNSYQGALWWKEHYSILPSTTKNCLESILNHDAHGEQQRADFAFAEALRSGLANYMQMTHQRSLKKP